MTFSDGSRSFGELGGYNHGDPPDFELTPPGDGADPIAAHGQDFDPEDRSSGSPASSDTPAFGYPVHPDYPGYIGQASDVPLPPIYPIHTYDSAASWEASTHGSDGDVGNGDQTNPEETNPGDAPVDTDADGVTSPVPAPRPQGTHRARGLLPPVPVTPTVKPPDVGSPTGHVGDVPRVNICEMGEQDRTTGFKASRGELIVGVEGIAADLVARRDTAGTLADGTPITDNPRVTRTLLGQAVVFGDVMATEETSGVSVTGDGVTTPVVVQRVRRLDDEIPTVEVVEVTGRDPLQQQVHGDKFSNRFPGDRVQYELRTTTPFGEQYTRIAVEESGAARIGYFDDERGTHTTVPLRTPKDFERAQKLLREIAERLT